MFVKRKIESAVKLLINKFPVVSLTGPRQSGKTTFLRRTFPDYNYLSLENLDNYDFATKDPKGFLNTYSSRIIIDEAQRVPSLFSYLQQVVDETNEPGQYILSGSQNFLLHKRITQSLAGRVAIFKLFPFDQKELDSEGLLPENWMELAWKGAYPRIYQAGIPPESFYPNYIETYLERDIQELVKIEEMGAFRQFLRLCAGRAGQILNLSALGRASGISHATARNWISLLESSFIVLRLSPYFKNYNKRLVKSPKLYFWDTGLLLNLLGVKEQGELILHPNKGNIFENLIISESYKRRHHIGERPNFYFWRDSNNNEIDLLEEIGQDIKIAEIKASETLNMSYFKGLEKFPKEAPVSRKLLIYAGEEEQKRTIADVQGWRSFEW